MWAKIKWPFYLFLLALLGTLVVYFLKGFWKEPNFKWGQTSIGAMGPEAVLENYGKEIDQIAKEFKINPSYLKALCMLESSGRKPVPPRFEKHVYRRLLLVKKGINEQYEHVQSKHISDIDDEGLMNLASSWGPFQLMGYKCLLLDIKIKDIRGEESVYWGVKWIDMTYGKYLKENRYEDAFHIHNTGMPFPKNKKPRTYDPNYVESGKKWMKYFDSLEKN